MSPYGYPQDPNMSQQMYTHMYNPYYFQFMQQQHLQNPYFQVFNK